MITDQEPDSDQSKNTAEPSSAPLAAQKPKVLEIHGDRRVDDYYWLRDDQRTDPEVLSYLEAENAYFEAKTAHTNALQETLFQEIIGRIKQDDASVPIQVDDYWYYRRYEEGQDYPIYARKKGKLKAAEQILLDVNQLAQPHEYYNIGNYEVSDDHRIIAFAEDTVSRRQYTIKFKEIDSGRLLDDQLTNTSSAMAWSADGSYLFYVKKNPQTLLPYQVWRHQLGQPESADTLIYEEQDTTFSTSLYRGKSRDYIYVHLGSTVADEVRLIPAAQPLAELRTFLPRQRGHEYSVDDVDGRFYILTNWQAENFRVMQTDWDGASERERWTDVIAHRDDVLLHAIEVYRHYLVVNERVEGLRQLRVLPQRDGAQAFVIESDEPAYASYIAANVDVASDTLRYYHSSLTTPGTIFDFDMASGERTLMKRDVVVDENFAPSNYQTERFRMAARDGKQVPVSVVYRKDMGPLQQRPLLIYAYGSYGSSTDPTFSSSRLSLLDRGFVYAIAHVRGGQELGRQWYEDGKMFNKMNTFTDFIDVTQGLVERGYGDRQRVYAFGGSAGGLLMGAIVNMAPQLYHGVMAAVPFVDVITTMLDETIPLTTGEFDEWGNPKNKQQYDYMKSYSPYDQAKAQAYPNLLVTTGLHDSQVQYWEPAKWVAKLRRLKTDDNLLLLYTDLASGHGGASGRFKRHRDTAREYAFLIDLAN